MIKTFAHVVQNLAAKPFQSPSTLVEAIYGEEIHPRRHLKRIG
jgi:hypothetical protein